MQGQGRLLATLPLRRRPGRRHRAGEQLAPRTVQGDSGAPALVEGALVGLVVGQQLLAPARPRDGALNPSVILRTARFCAWLAAESAGAVVCR